MRRFKALGPSTSGFIWVSNAEFITSFGADGLVTLASSGTTTPNLGGGDTVTLDTAATGLSMNPGDGFNTVTLTGLSNVISLGSVGTVNGSSGSDVVNFAADPALTNEAINLGASTDVLNLMGQDGSLTLCISGGG